MLKQKVLKDIYQMWGIIQFSLPNEMGSFWYTNQQWHTPSLGRLLTKSWITSLNQPQPTCGCQLQPVLPVRKFASNKLIAGTPCWFGCSLTGTTLTSDYAFKTTTFHGHLSSPLHCYLRLDAVHFFLTRLLICLQSLVCFGTSTGFLTNVCSIRKKSISLQCIRFFLLKKISEEKIILWMLEVTEVIYLSFYWLSLYFLV